MVTYAAQILYKRCRTRSEKRSFWGQNKNNTLDLQAMNMRVTINLLKIATSSIGLFAFATMGLAATFNIEKRNTGFSMDGANGARLGQQTYLWNTNVDNVNQKWEQLTRQGGYYAYRKEGTNLCWDGGNGGSNGQAITLQACNENNQNQHWLKVKVISGTEVYRFEKRNASGFSIDGNRGASRRQGIYLWKSNSNNINQQWELVRTDTNSGATPIATTTPTTNGNDIPDYITDESLFELEGENPHPLVNRSTLRFLPLETKFTTSGGHGWRHEYKIDQPHRIAMTDTYEVFKATVTVDMSDGGKTIIAQHHAGGSGTISKVYVSDSSESGFYDSIPDNGIFDVYVRLRNTDGNEEKYAFGTIKSGETFDLRVLNNYGFVEVSAFGDSFGIEVEDDSASYFKFGNYLQSQSPYGSVNCGERGDSDSFEECYDDLGITKASVIMTDLSYDRVENN